MGPFHASNMSPIEVGWTAVALVGLLSMGWMLRDARGDLNYLRRSGLNGARLIVARQSARREWVRLGEMLLLLAIGVGALLRANAPTPITPAQVVYTLLALYIPVAQTANSIKERWDRTRLLAYMQAAEERQAREAREGC